MCRELPTQIYARLNHTPDKSTYSRVNAIRAASVRIRQAEGSVVDVAVAVPGLGVYSKISLSYDGKTLMNLPCAPEKYPAPK